MPLFDTPSPDLGRNPRLLQQHLAGVQRDMQQLQAQIADLANRLTSAPQSVDYAAVRDALQARGAFPLNVEQLPGHLAEAQPSGLVQMLTASTPDPARYPLGTLGRFGATIYEVRANASGVHTWNALPIAPTNYWTTDSPQTIATGAAKTLADLLTLNAGLRIAGTHGAQWTALASADEELTVTGVANIDTAASLIPASSLVLFVGWQITQTISGGGVTGFQLGDAVTPSAARFATSATLTAGSGGTGMDQWKGGVATDATGPLLYAASKVRVTLTGGVPTAGKIRVIVFSASATAPTS